MSSGRGYFGVMYSDTSQKTKKNLELNTYLHKLLPVEKIQNDVNNVQEEVRLALSHKISSYVQPRPEPHPLNACEILGIPLEFPAHGQHRVAALTPEVIRYLNTRDEIVHTRDDITQYLYAESRSQVSLYLLHDDEHGALKLALGINYDCEKLQDIQARCPQYIIYRLEFKKTRNSTVKCSINVSMFTKFNCVEELCDAFYRFVNMIDFEEMGNLSFVKSFYSTLINFLKTHSFAMNITKEMCEEYIMNYNEITKPGYTLTFVLLTKLFDFDENIINYLYELVQIDMNHIFIKDIKLIFNLIKDELIEYFNMYKIYKYHESPDFYSPYYVPSIGLPPLFDVDVVDDIDDDDNHKKMLTEYFRKSTEYKVKWTHKKLDNFSEVFLRLVFDTFE